VAPDLHSQEDARRGPLGETMASAPDTTADTATWANRPTADADAPERQHRWQVPALAPQLARGIVVAVFGGFSTIALLRIVSLDRGAGYVLLSASCLIALLSLQLFYFSRPAAQLRSPLGYLALVVQAGLVYLPLLQFKQAWVGMPGFLAGSVLLVLPARIAWPAFALIVASMAGAQAVLTGGPFDIAYTAVSTVITGLVVYGLTRLASMVTELHAARTELAQMAVAQERLRFARDLHDLLGYSLSAITLKSELTHRLVGKNPVKAQEELSEVLDISRRALADVRAVASGYRELSLAAESESARSVLAAADVDVSMDLDYGVLPSHIRTVLATVLREGVTNLLRHSKAERCDITVRQERGKVWIEIVNDGVPSTPAEPVPQGGSGIHNLSVRVRTLAGTLNAGVDDDGRFRLRASVPVSQFSIRQVAGSSG
jgi:two-component system sensor histidine kinase DesK